MTLELMKELFGIAHIIDNEEEAPNVMCMHVGEEEVSMSQPITAAVPPEEDDVLVPQGLHRLLPEEEDIPVPLERPPITVPAPLVTVPRERWGCLVPVPPLVSSSPFFFSQKHRRFILPFFS
jgi:hypothetical protein